VVLVVAIVHLVLLLKFVIASHSQVKVIFWHASCGRLECSVICTKSERADILAALKPPCVVEGIKELSAQFFMEKVVWIHLLYNPPHVAKQLSLDLFEKVY
jgi:hypothetical protein